MLQPYMLLPRMWGCAMLDSLDQFRAQLTRRGILPKGGEIVADGRIQRCDAEGRGGKGDAAYLLHLDGIPAGGFENWRDGFGWEIWRADIDRALSPAEEAAHRAKLENSRRERELEEAKRKATARKRALSVFEDAALCDSHPYTARKGIQTHGARMQGDHLVLPLRDVDGKVHSLQFIGADGEKRYLTGGRKAGCYFDIGQPDGVLCVAEGFATGASIHEATGYAVAVAFDGRQPRNQQGHRRGAVHRCTAGRARLRRGSAGTCHRLQRPAPVRRPGCGAALHRRCTQAR